MSTRWLSVAAPRSFPNPRSYDREDMVFDPIHYLALLENKIGALAGRAASRMPDFINPAPSPGGTHQGRQREYVFRPHLEVLHGAVKDALRLGAIGYDAVKHLVLMPYRDARPSTWISIPTCANVATTAAASYMSLLGGGAS